MESILIMNIDTLTIQRCTWATYTEQGRNTRSVILNAEKVKEIKVMLQSKINQNIIAEKYGVNSRTISAINTNKIWKGI